MPKCPQCGVDHRGLCHACPHNGRVGGDYRNSPCSRCQTAEAMQQGHGRNASYEQLAGVLPDRHQVPARDELTPALDALSAVIGLDAEGREIVFRYLIEPEITLEGVANYLAKTFRRPYTPQAVHWRVKVMQRKSEALARLLVRVDARMSL